MSLRLPDLTISSGQTSSNTFNFTKLYRSIKSIYITSPASFGTGGTITVYTAASPTGTFVPLQSGGADVTLTASKGIEITVAAWGALKIVAASDPGTNLVFEVSGTEEMYG